MYTCAYTQVDQNPGSPTAERVAVWEVDSQGLARLRELGPLALPIWEPHYCVLAPRDAKLRHFRNEKVAREKSEKRADTVRLDGGKKEFDSWWGYESLASIKENNALPSGVSKEMAKLSPDWQDLSSPL
ncbi:hypothetical protein LSAT2_031415 [Lamellibrachia satsuma]|nr:hypothetical protein LSAT2_031415 [Lamellibrachia satsuma]